MHDARMLALSDLYDELGNFAFSPTGAEMCLYGDAAYPLRVHLQAPFRIGILTRDMEMFNDSMSAVRVSVEWLFADIINYFKFLDFKKDLKTGLLIFRAVAEPRISSKSAKSREIHKNTRNPSKFATNLTKYMSAQHI